MLPPFIIEQIRQREEKERERRESDQNQPRLELPVDRYPARRPSEPHAPGYPGGHPQTPGYPGAHPEHEEDDPNRGVIILELV